MNVGFVQADRLRGFCMRMSYKPNFYFHVQYQGGQYEPVYLALSVLVDDIADPTKKIRLAFYKPFNPWMLESMPDDQLIYLIKEHVIRWEDHERKEWLKLDGVCLDDPHSEHLSPEPQHGREVMV